MIVLSDMHFDNHGEFAVPWKDGCNSRLQAQLDVLTKVFAICEELSERVIVFDGDWFHRWRMVDTAVHSMVTRHLYDLLGTHPQMRIIMIPGNHDMLHKGNSMVTTIDAYGAHPQISLYDTPTAQYVDETPCVFLPYNQDHTQIHKDALRLHHGGKDCLLFAHLEIIGAEASIDGYVAKDGISLDELDVYGGGVFGHFHKPQEFLNHAAANFTYVGSPLQLSWVDAMAGPTAESMRGVLWVRNGVTRRCPLDSPKFVKLEGIKQVRTDLREQDYHLVNCSVDEAEEVVHTFTRTGVPRFKVMARKPVKEGGPVVRHVTNSDAIEAYVNAKGPLCEVELATLLDYGRAYAGEAK